MISDTFTYKFKIPDIFSCKKYDFIFIGFEDQNDNLIKRIDTTYSNEQKYITIDKECKHIVFLGYIDGEWDNIREEVLGKDCLVNLFSDLILPLCDYSKNIPVKIEEFNKKVTIVFVEEKRELEIEKITHLYKSIGLTNIKVINSKNYNIEPVNTSNEYKNFIVKNLYKFIDTDYVLISSWDAFIINYNMFKKEFFNYDCIGDKNNYKFSFFSKKFLLTISKLEKNNFKKQLKKLEIKFSDKIIENTFTTKNNFYSNQFGFNGFNVQGLPIQAKQFFNKKFHHSGDLGDLIFSLPTIKALGGGILHISNDMQYFQKRSKFSEKIKNQLVDFLKHQEYIVNAYNNKNLPFDVDFDLNKFRRRQLLQFNGTLNEKDLKDFNDYWPNTTITRLHLEEFGCDINSDVEPWLKWDKKIVYFNKPIIINRTERYLNPKFPWNEILEKYGDQCYFVGSKTEHLKFCNNYRYVDYLDTPTIISLVEVVLGSKLVIGNMSFPVALCEGFKHNCLVESGVDVRSNNYERHNINVPDPDNINTQNVLEFIEKYVNF